MKTTKLSELPILPQEYDLEHYFKIQYPVARDVGMSDSERRLVNGLIRYYQPDCIIELGVSTGAGTLNILNAISDQNSKLVSIDILEELDDRMFHRVGERALREFSDHPRWRLFTGVDASEIIEGLDIKFDFAVIDTAHLHPVESLNFLTLLPWLNDGAIVVVHDISDFWDQPDNIAPLHLFSTVCAEKIIAGGDDWHSFSNIGAFQITQDTRKYIRNVFDALMFKWNAFPFRDIANVFKLLNKYYSNENMMLFRKAFIANIGLTYTSLDTLKQLPEDTIFYGAGRNMKGFLSIYEILDIPFNFKIWDVDAEKISAINGYNVSQPDFITFAQNHQLILITISDSIIQSTIERTFRMLNYRAFAIIPPDLSPIKYFDLLLSQ